MDVQCWWTDSGMMGGQAGLTLVAHAGLCAACYSGVTTREITLLGARAGIVRALHIYTCMGVWDCSRLALGIVHDA